MKKLIILFLSCFLFLGTAGVSTVSAAEFRTGQDVVISEGTSLEDAYLFGNNIQVNAPITNDAVVAGSAVNINKNVTGSIMATGGNITIAGAAGNTIRAAGGNIRIDAPVARDLMVAGGSIITTTNARIGRDLVVAGGNITLEGPINGKVVINGGNVTINSSVAGNVEGEIEKLTLGPNARIAGNLSYKSPEKAQLANGAVVQGKTTYTPVERTQKHEEKAREFITGGSLYKLATDIIISILLIYFFGRLVTAVLARMREKSVESGAIGFGFVLLFPIAALLLLILIWLGIAAWLVYGFTLLVSLYLAKIFLGWLIMRWWEKRNNKDYVLDWKAGVLGPLALFVIMFVPILGWLAAAILFFIATGAFLHGSVRLLSGQKLLAKTPAKKK